jgi:hypothetical protein
LNFGSSVPCKIGDAGAGGQAVCPSALKVPDFPESHAGRSKRKHNVQIIQSGCIVSTVTIGAALGFSEQTNAFVVAKCWHAAIGSPRKFADGNRSRTIIILRHSCLLDPQVASGGSNMSGLNEGKEK